MRAIAAVSMLSGSGASRSGGGGAQEVAQELRVAARALGREPQDVRRERRRLGDRLGQGERLGSGQRAGLDVRPRPVPGAPGSPRPCRGARRRRATAAADAARRSPPEQVRRGGVHEVRVLDLDQRGLAQPVAQEAQHDLVQLARAGTRARARRPGAWRGMSAPKRRCASSGSQGSSVGVPRRRRRARRRSTTTSSGSSQAIPMSGRRSSRQAAYGVEVVYASHVACRRAARRARSRSSSISRVLPMPGSPVISTSRPAPRPTEAHARSSSSGELARRGRPAGSAAPRPRATRLPIAGPTDHAWTGLLLALDRERLERARSRTAWPSGRGRRPSRRSSPGGALAITRAARFTASPITL